MIVAIDSNVIVGLWNSNDALNFKARKALEAAYATGGLVICGAVFGELLGCPGRTQGFINGFLDAADITVDWTTDEAIWTTAGKAFCEYSDRRRKQKSDMPRRILADFLIGAHALENDYGLLTLDDGIFRAAFPKLQIFRV